MSEDAPDALGDLAGAVNALERQPVHEHASVLERVHEGIVAELDGVGGWQQPQAVPGG